jgi:hypothetical protein
MTNSKDVKQRNTKIISTGLAVATGIGIVGVIGFRTIEDAAAQSAPATTSVDASSVEVPTLEGYSAEQLQAYAEALSQEAVRLSEYRDQLNAVAQQLVAAQAGGAVTVSSKPAQSPVASSAPTIAPVPSAAKPPALQTNSQGSG